MIKTGLILVTMLAGVVLLLWLFFPNCYEDSRKAKHMRSLSEERLEQLYQQVKDIYKTYKLERRPTPLDYESIDYDEAPEYLKDIPFIFLRLYGLYPRMRLQGYFDHHQDLLFHGIEESDEESPRIVMRSGEWDIVEEVLWEERAGRDSRKLVPERGTVH